MDTTTLDMICKFFGEDFHRTALLFSSFIFIYSFCKSRSLITSFFTTIIFFIGGDFVLKFVQPLLGVKLTLLIVVGLGILYLIDCLPKKKKKQKIAGYWKNDGVMKNRIKTYHLSSRDRYYGD